MRCACIAFSLEHCQAGCQYLPATYIFMITAKACGFVCVYVFTTILCFWSIYGWGIITTTTLTPLCLHFVCEFIQAPSLRPFHFFFLCKHQVYNHFMFLVCLAEGLCLHYVCQIWVLRNWLSVLPFVFYYICWLW